jgi:hypothetical protein
VTGMFARAVSPGKYERLLSSRPAAESE